MVSTRDWAPDPELLEVTKKHLQPVLDLETAILRDLEVSKYSTRLSSKGIRRNQCTMGSLVTSSVKKALKAQCCMLNAGSIRGNLDYDADHKYFTFGDLKTEVPFDSEVVICQIPGHVLAAAVKWSRKGWKSVDSGGFLQVDNGVKVDIVEDGSDPGHHIVEMNHQPFNPDQQYRVVLLYSTLNGMDNIVPIKDYAAANRAFLPPEDAGLPLKIVLANYFYAEIWTSLGDLSKLDLNGDGKLDKSEIKAALLNKTGVEVPDTTIERIVNAMDLNKDGSVELKEAIEGVIKVEEAHTRHRG